MQEPVGKQQKTQGGGTKMQFRLLESRRSDKVGVMLVVWRAVCMFDLRLCCVHVNTLHLENQRDMG